MVVLLLPARSAEPPQNSGSTPAMALMTLPDEALVAMSSPVSNTGMASWSSSGRRRAMSLSSRAAFSWWRSLQVASEALHSSCAA